MHVEEKPSAMLSLRALGIFTSSSDAPCPGCRAVRSDILAVGWTCPHCGRDHLGVGCAECGMVNTLGTDHGLIEHGNLIESFARHWLNTRKTSANRA
jgi:hypothetical protein